MSSPNTMARSNPARVGWWLITTTSLVRGLKRLPSDSQTKVRTLNFMNQPCGSWDPAIVSVLCWEWLEAWFSSISLNLQTAVALSCFIQKWVISDATLRLEASSSNTNYSFVIFMPFCVLSAGERVMIRLLASKIGTISSVEHENTSAVRVWPFNPSLLTNHTRKRCMGGQSLVGFVRDYATVASTRAGFRYHPRYPLSLA